MLKTRQKYREIVLIGSTSDIGISIINQLELKDRAHIHLIGRSNPEPSRFVNSTAILKFYSCDFMKSEEVSNFINNIDTFCKAELVIIAAGILSKENSEFDIESLNALFRVNSLSSILILSAFAKLMNENSGGQILVCSSVASIRPRLRNFSYGSSKTAIDFFAVGLQNKLRNSTTKLLILRPGYVHSKMTKDFIPAPFSINLNVLAKMACKAIEKEKKIIYAPRKIKLIFLVLRILPRAVFDKLTK